MGALAVATGANEEIFTVAVVAAVFHIINHATFKGSLFMVAGILDHETGTRSIRKLGGLLTLMPISFTMTLVTALSMAGIPPFNGFLSKELFLEAMFEISHANFSALADWSVLFPILGIVGSIFTFVYSLKLIHGVFFGDRSYDTPKEPHEAPALLLISPIILSALVIIFGLFPNILSGTIIDPAAMSILGTDTALNTQISHWHGFNNPALWATVAIIVIGGVMYIFRNSWMFIYDYHKEHFTLNYLYEQGLLYSQLGSKKATDGVMTGFFRDYMVYIFGFFVLFSIITTFFTGLPITFDDFADVGIQDMVLVIIILISLAIIMMTRSRMVSILSLIHI